MNSCKPRFNFTHNVDIRASLEEAEQDVDLLEGKLEKVIMLNVVIYVFLALSMLSVTLYSQLHLVCNCIILVLWHPLPFVYWYSEERQNLT